MGFKNYNPQTLAEFRTYLKAELAHGWTDPTQWTKGFDACLIRYIQKINEFIGEEAVEHEETCPECEGRGCKECVIILDNE